MIRNATLNDLSSILDIIEDARITLRALGTLQWNTIDGYPTKEIILKDIQNQTLYLYEEQEILGIMTCIKGIETSYQQIDGAWLTCKEPYMTIHRLATKKSSYRLGVATKLIAFAKLQAKKQNSISIRIDTHPLNLPMQKLLIKQNFSYCGKIFLFQKEDALRWAYEYILEQKLK